MLPSLCLVSLLFAPAVRAVPGKAQETRVDSAHDNTSVRVAIADAMGNLRWGIGRGELQQALPSVETNFGGFYGLLFEDMEAARKSANVRVAASKRAH